MKGLWLPKDTATYVDTPQGIFTDALVWFRTREAWLRDYASPVLAHKSLSHLLAEAVVWLRSPQTLALWLLAVLLLVAGAIPAALITVAFFVAWTSFGPLLVARSAITLLRVLDVVLLQALAFVTVLSWLASQGDYAAVGIGMAGFIALRWDLLRMAFQPVFKRLWRAMYRMPVPDQVLRALIVRTALRYRVTLADFASIEEGIVQHFNNR